MGKLIDADLLKTWLDMQENAEDGEFITARTVKNFIDILPEAVVRCKECKYWDTQDRSAEDVAKCGYWSMDRFLIFTNTDDYCSRAERRTDETD